MILKLKSLRSAFKGAAHSPCAQVRCRRCVSQPHNFELVLYDGAFPACFDVFVRQCGAVDFLVACCAGVVRGRVVVGAQASKKS